MAEVDYYALIGVEQGATLQEIRSKFRQKVLAEHPDRGGDAKKFQLLNKAYNVLMDKDKRKRYDATGRAEKTVEEEFLEGFAGGRVDKERQKEADAKAVVSLQERIHLGPQNHQDGFAEWLRQRDSGGMVLTDKDFLKSHLFNAAELVTQLNHQAAVQHVLGSPKMDAYGQPLGGAVQVQIKPRNIKKALDHDEIAVRMLAVPVDESMVFADLTNTGVCLGTSGVGRVFQVGQRIEALKAEEAVLVLPKLTKFSPQRPIGTGRTLLTCHEEDVLRIPAAVLEELTPEQICLMPTIVAAYVVLERFGASLKAGDSVLLNAAHLSTMGTALLQLCKLLKLKPLCILSLPGAPKTKLRGEYGSTSVFANADVSARAPPTVRAQYERISERLVALGAEEVFPDAVALLHWRDRNQRMLPKLALDGVATRDSCEDLIHCLQPGDKDARVVVVGHGVAQPIEVSPPLLASWGGALTGFNMARWVHAETSNQQRMMSIMENITKLIRANKFVLDALLYTVGGDPIGDAFTRAADAADSSQIVLIFPTLEEEARIADEERRKEEEQAALQKKQDEERLLEEEGREKLKNEWLNVLFTDESVAAMSPEGPVPVVLEAGNMDDPSTLLVWIGDNPAQEHPFLEGLDTLSTKSVGLVSCAWSQHTAGEGLKELLLDSKEVVDGSWYRKDRAGFENQDLDLLHDVELLGRSFTEAIESRLGEFGLDWQRIVVIGFGKGAGIALYASLLRLFPKQVAALVLFNPVVVMPNFLGERLPSLRPPVEKTKVFAVWDTMDRATPGAYRQLMAQHLKKVPQVVYTPVPGADGGHKFDQRNADTLTQLLPLCMPK